MRRFSSYGPIDTDSHYYTPRTDLIAKGFSQLMGENYEKGGHYFTVWAPRQTGKTWIMREVLFKLKEDPRLDVVVVNLENLKNETEMEIIFKTIAEEIGEELNRPLTEITTQTQFQKIFKNDILKKPLILILDEFDALPERAINDLVTVFRSIYNNRQYQKNKPTDQKTYLLHSVALIGVRNVLGIENQKGSPFNVQRSLHIPNLTNEEVKEIFHWYEKESGQKIEPEVIDRIYYETNGQPGLTCWLGEVLTETENHEKSLPITMKHYEYAYISATRTLPNNNILNLISKARQEPYKPVVLELFKTDRKMDFRFDDDQLNFLYMNGIIDIDRTETGAYCKFANPFVQSRLFNHFAGEYFKHIGTLVDPFMDLDHVITPATLNIPELIRLYQQYLDKNHEWLFKNAPRRTDLKIYEAVYHFNLFSYLHEFLRDKGGNVIPEFPTGNGIIDLIITYAGQTFGLELKSYTDKPAYEASLKKATVYGKRLGLETLYLLFFVPALDEKNRKKLEMQYKDSETGITVIPLFIATGC